MDGYFRKVKAISIGNKFYLTVLSLFLVFAVAFIVFQQSREKQYKIGLLEARLESFNARVHEAVHGKQQPVDSTLAALVHSFNNKELRVTLVRKDGRVLYDNFRHDYARMPNHASRPEIHQALTKGHGISLARHSTTLDRNYFYSATYFKEDGLVVRTALPYDNNLARTLQADQHFIWFALVVMALLTLVLYRFVNRLGTNITKLRIFASRAAHNESLDTEDLVVFPDDELGGIAERIIKIYKRLQSTRREQDILKRQLTQNVAHELKTPVASIQGYLETILENPHIDAPTKEMFLKRCYAQSERLTSLLRDISTLNRLDDAPYMQDFEDVNISEMVQNIQKETALQLEQRHMTFHDYLPGELIVKGSQSLLYSVFRNLTDNAVTYAGEGTSITLTAERHTDYWTFVFSDNGVGVPLEHLSRLFERFYRVDKGRSRKMGGTGLGLAIVKDAVLLHKGTVNVRNNPDGGLRFTFTIEI